MKLESARRYLFGGVLLGLLSLTALIGLTPPAQSHPAESPHSSTPLVDRDTSSDTGAVIVRPMLVATVTVHAVLDTAEGSSTPGEFRISQNSTATVRVFYDILGTARNGTDYERIPNHVDVPANGSVRIFIRPIDDALDEEDETVTLDLIDTTNYDPGSPSRATISIADNDVPGPPPPTPTPAPEIRITNTRFGPPWLYLWKQALGTSLSDAGGFTAQRDGILFEGANTSGERIVFFSMDGSGGRIHQGGNESGEILFTVDFLTGRIWAGPNTSGPLLYTLETVSQTPHLNVRVRAGSSKGPIIYTISDDDVYAGPNVSSPFVYHGSEPFHGPIQFLLPLLADARIP